MYYNKKKLILNIMWLIIGITLITLELTGIISNTIFACMGGSFFAIGMLQTVRIIKYHSNKEYKEKMDITYSDERNRYVHIKALAFS